MIMDCMVFINLHETKFLEEVLTVLAEEHVRDCVVYTVDGVASHHGMGRVDPFVFGSISRLFSQERNVNKLIIAVTEQKNIEAITNRLKTFYKQDRWASSFWFVPISGYFYHKHSID
ncbi:MAG TPA: hypothetical protein VJL89_03080 [Thermodesulfovibrionia bacterium]|nr:hypothetical protein [Thermodesulfovibrionia bacterium]